MAWIAALTDPETELGFRLAGIETFSARNSIEAERFLKELFGRKAPGILVIGEEFIPDFPEGTRKRVEEGLQPVCVPLPHIQSWREGEKKEDYLSRLMQHVMGVQIKIKR